MTADFDIAVAGSGFGGALLAAIASRIGLRTILVERGRHPRFMIGESTSPLANLVLEGLAARYDLPRLAPLVKYGRWTRELPEVRRGLKRGFTFYGHEAGRPFARRDDRANELLVAASPNDEVADTHWLRADVDHHFVREAERAGVEVVDETALDEVTIPGGGGAATLAGTRLGRPVRFTARFVVDATGPNGLLSRALGLGTGTFDGFPRTHTIYSHFTGVARCEAMPEFVGDREAPPYPVDAAAVHQVFDGGWMWQLRFDDGVTSAGFMLEDRLAREVGLADGDPDAWRRTLARFPTIERQFAEAEAIRDFATASGLATRARAATGDGWALLPSAAGFVDPLFSTGIPLTLLGVERLGRLFETRGAGLSPHLGEYAARTLGELDHTARYVAACYRAFGDFPAFANTSMFYFAAASYAEAARRLGRGDLARGFLASDRPAVVEGIAACAGPGAKNDEVARRVEPINVAGLCDPSKRNWYGVDFADTMAAAPKLGVSEDDVRAMLRAAGVLAEKPAAVER